MKITVTISKMDMAKTKRALAQVADMAPQVMARAINKTLTSLRTVAVDEIAQRLNVTKTRIRKDFGIRLAHYTDLRGILYARGKRINLASFIGTRQTAKGVTVEVIKGTKRSLFPGAFIWERPTKSGEDAATVLQREWHDFRRPKRQIPYGALPDHMRLPVKALTGPSPESQMARPEIMTRILDAGAELLKKHIAHEVDYELKKINSD